MLTVNEPEVSEKVVTESFVADEEVVVKEIVRESESTPFSSPISNIEDNRQGELVNVSPQNEKLQDYQGIKLECLPTKQDILGMKTERSTAIDNFEWKFDDDEEEIGGTLESRYRSSGRGEVVNILHIITQPSSFL